MMKRKISVMMLLIFALTFVLPFTALAESSYVVDNGAMLSNAQKKILEVRCDWLYEDGIELVIYTDKEPAADLDAKMLEIAESTLASGLVFYTDAETEKLALRAFGDAEYAYSEEQCQEVLALAEEKLENVGFYEACQCVVKNINSLNSGEPELYTDEAYMPAVWDEAGYLTDEQVEELTEKLDALRKKYRVDVAIMVEEIMIADDAQQAADDIYGYHFYGLGEDDDGILLYVSKNPRSYYFTTHAYAQSAFNQNGLAYLEGKVVPHLKEDDYYAAFTAYAETADELLGMAAQGTPYNKKPPKNIWPVIAAVIIVPFVVAFTMTGAKVKKMKTAVSQDYANHYVKSDSMRLDVAQDIFMYSTVHRTERPKDTESSHTSSSGRSHGGTGGSY